MTRTLLPLAAALCLSAAAPALAAPEHGYIRLAQNDDHRDRGDRGDRGDERGRDGGHSQGQQIQQPPRQTQQAPAPQTQSPRQDVRSHEDWRRSPNTNSTRGTVQPGYNANPGASPSWQGRQQTGGQTYQPQNRDNGRDQRDRQQFNSPAYQQPNRDYGHDQRDRQWNNGSGYEQQNRDYYGRDRRSYEHRDFDWRSWQRNERAERRYYWRPYERPYGWYYRQWSFGMYLPYLFWQNRDYWIRDYWDFGLPEPPYGYIWVRDGDDALLINAGNGYILQVVYSVFY